MSNRNNVNVCRQWIWSDDNDTVSGIAILDTTAIPEMRSAILVSFRIRQSQYSVYSQTVAVIKIVCIRVCIVLWHAVTTYTIACLLLWRCAVQSCIALCNACYYNNYSIIFLWDYVTAVRQVAALLLLSLRKRIAVALCAAKINTKIENLTPCKIVAAVNLQCVAYLKNCINTIEVLIDSLLATPSGNVAVMTDGQTHRPTDRPQRITPCKIVPCR